MAQRKRKRCGWVVKIGRVFLVSALVLYLTSLATGYVSAYNWDPFSRLMIELYGRPWCVSHRYPVPMYVGHLREICSAHIDGVTAGVYSPWVCPVCGTNWKDRSTFWMFIHGRDLSGRRLKKPTITLRRTP